MRYRTFTEKSSLFRILGEIGILLSRSGKKLISHLSLPQAMNTLCCMQRCVSWCSTRDVACPRGVVGTRSPHACPVLPQVVSRRGHAACFRHCMPGKTMWVPPAPGAWQALLWDGDGGLAFLVLDQEIKLPGLRFTPPGEVLLASGRCSLQERVQDLTSSGAQSSARGRLSSRGRARHSRWPGSPFSACLAGPWSPIPAALLECM